MPKITYVSLELSPLPKTNNSLDLCKMASSSKPSSTALWALRSIVAGSFVVTGVHFYPMIQESTMKNAVQLASETHSMYVLEGIRRINRQVRQSDSRRHGLLKYGAISVLTEAINHKNEEVKDAALESLSLFAFGAVRDAQLKDDMHSSNASRQLLSFPSVASALIDDNCGKGCHALWNVVVKSQHQIDRPGDRLERIAMLKRFESVNS